MSIIFLFWACADFIAETIRSIQVQTYQNLELLIQDDCSKDNTLEVVKPYMEADYRIKYERNPQNSGAAITRNNVLRRAKGRWIAFLDSDDLWLPEKLERQLRFMVENGYAFSYHEYTEMSEEGKDLGILNSGRRRVGVLGMFTCCWPGCLTVMYDASVVGTVQIVDIHKNNDIAMWLKVVKKADCFLLKENLALYRRRKGSITPQSSMVKLKWMYKLYREQLGIVASAFFAVASVAGHVYKRMFYVKHMISNNLVMGRVVADAHSYLSSLCVGGCEQRSLALSVA